ncbi:DUF1127 domain-containing protein [Hwanghaeella grinnelliae]|uniref:DUF1127 domain-containing protein n=1 Tax=Hwanghaeella grinnelliae TaxID=2500179 RepID=A0A3S2Y1M4_9PROT|nr:DUF1127 domain-containing protein [Hwanghaeella grinnelliae]RVU35134.1 DUF1127 domain-containing protein [Hwanghaeella grinnelliae]
MYIKHVVFSSPSYAFAGLERLSVALWQSVCGVAERVVEANRCRRDYERLEELPDFLLDDIGITRGEIKAAARRNAL